MKELLEISKKERAQYFNEAAARSNKIKNPIIFEKDFWVCWTLNRIFKSELSNHVIFKGGTSLSKCYGVIERFSEDIDLTLSKEYIGITSASDPANFERRSQRDKRSEQFTKLCQDKIHNTIQPLLIGEFNKELSIYFNQNEWNLEPEQDEKGNLFLKFSYPNTLQKKSDGYIESVVKLEFGARGDISPAEQKIIIPYVKEILPLVSDSTMQTAVNTLTAKRTYWEKATLLHAEYYRDIEKPLNSRIFRHYYDLVMLDQSGFTKEAIQDAKLLADVVKNKSIYFPSSKAKYDEAKIGTLQLYPNEAFIGQLKQDHQKMSEMFFGNIPDFDDILSRVRVIETIINSSLAL